MTKMYIELPVELCNVLHDRKQLTHMHLTLFLVTNKRLSVKGLSPYTGKTRMITVDVDEATHHLYSLNANYRKMLLHEYLGRLFINYYYEGIEIQ